MKRTSALCSNQASHPAPLESFFGDISIEINDWLEGLY